MYGLYVTCLVLSTVNMACTELSISTPESEEVCAAELFSPRCLKNEVIVMTSAVYGRMRVGRCLENEDSKIISQMRNDPQYLGCSTDVLPLLDKRCSGKHQCEIRPVVDIDLNIEKPCLSGLANYLEASYYCAVVTEPDRTCTTAVSTSPVHILLQPSTPTHQPSTPTHQTCATRDQPWTLEAPVGQQIQVSLLDFSPADTSSGNFQQKSCPHPAGYILDVHGKTNYSICKRDDVRDDVIYSSAGNRLQLVFKRDAGDGWIYLVGFKATGCTNLLPPEEAWVRREGREVVVGCYSSRLTWHLHCEDNNWVGSVGNCTRDKVPPDAAIEVLSKQSEPSHVLVTACVAVVGLVTCVLIIVCGAVCLKRYKVNKAAVYRHYGDVTAVTSSRALTNQRADQNCSADLLS